MGVLSRQASLALVPVVLASTVATAGVIARYSFDEGTGATVHDSSGNGLNGVTVGSPTWAAGISGNALVLDGVDDYVQIADAPALNGMSQLTIEAWVNPRVVNDGHIVTKWGCGSTEDDQYALRFFSGGGYNFAISSAMNQDKPVAGNVVPAGKWVYLAAVYSGDSLKMYVDGRVVLSKGSIKAAIKSVSQPLLLGSSCISAAPYLVDGAIDEITIRNDALSDSAIEAHYLALVPQAHKVIAYYSFDETTGSVLHDDSGSGLNGTVVGGATWSPAGGIKGGALDLNGVDGYAVVADNDAFTSASALTVEAWVYLRTYGSSEAVAFVSKLGSDSSSDDSWILCMHKYLWGGYDWAGKPDWTLSDGASRGDAFDPDSMRLGRWVALTGTWDGVTSRLYVNGLLVASTPWSKPLNNNTTPLYIGRAEAPYSHFLDGKIDEVRILNYALTQDEVRARYNAMSGNNRSVVARWQFDENAGSILHDVSGNGHNGVINGNPRWVPGICGAALNFDGVDDYVEFPHSDSFTNLNALTIAVWADIDSIIPTHSGLISKMGGPGAGRTHDCWWLGFSPDQGYNPKLLLSDGVIRTDVACSHTMPTRQWVYLVGTWDGDSIRVYMNGELENTYPYKASINRTTDPVRISNVAASGGFDGTVDEITIYNYALSPAEISAAYNTMKPQAVEVNLGMKTTYVAAGDEVWVPLYLANYEDFAISACQFVLGIDTSVVSFVSASKDSGIAADWMLSTSAAAGNAISVAMGGVSRALSYGEGELFRFLFKVKPTATKGAFSSLTLSSVSIDENNKVVPTTTAGKIVVDQASVLYGDVSGNKVVNVFDAQKILEYVVGSLKLPNAAAPNFTTAVADVSGNGQVTSYDAALVFQYSVGLIPQFPVERSGSARKMAKATVATASLSFSVTKLATGDAVFRLKGNNLAGFIAGEFSVAYDPAMVDLANGDISTPVRGATLKAKLDPTGKVLRLALTTNDDIDVAGDVELFAITAPATGTVNLSTALALRSVLLNEGRIPADFPGSTGIATGRTQCTSAPRVSLVAGNLVVRPNYDGAVVVSLYDMKGKRVLRSGMDAGTGVARIALGRLPAGTYVSRIRMGEKMVSYPLIVRPE